MSSVPFLGSEGSNFPSVFSALRRPNGLLAIGGDLRPETLVKAYSSGIFPWYNEGDPILWWHPEPRMIVSPGACRVSRSMKRLLASGGFEITANKAFECVISQCAKIPRKREEERSWITEELAQAYIKLHRMGIAHSVEARANGDLVGGLYGVSLGGCFFGESMFHKVPNASKAAFIALCEMLKSAGYTMIDCQVSSRHLASLGGVEISRHDFMHSLKKALAADVDERIWSRPSQFPKELAVSQRNPSVLAEC